MGLFDKLKAGLRRTAEQIGRGIGSVRDPGAALSPETMTALEEQLILADVGAGTARALVREIPGRMDPSAPSASEGVRKALRECVLERLRKPASTAMEPSGPVLVLLVGVNGVGKTTTAGKLAARWAGEGRRVILAAADTFRAAAEEQLTEWAKRAKVMLFRGVPNAAPSSVVFDALRTGVSQGYDRLVVDTAGRLHNRANLMEELRKIAKVAGKAAPGIPSERWLVVDASTGQNAVTQAREFGEAVGLTGIVLTKLDGTAKGGVAVALSEGTGVPIRYVGVGEGLEDLLPFDPASFTEALIP